MADEKVGNGAPSDVDYQTGEEDMILNRDRDFGKETKVLDVLDLNRKIEVLEKENSELILEKGKKDGRIKELMEEIEGLRSDGTAMKDWQEQLERKIEESAEDKKALQVVMARAVELETQVVRLQHDLGTSMNENDEAAAELRKLNDAVEELRQRNLTKEAKITELEKEKASLLERLEREVSEMKKSKSDGEIRIRDLKEKLSLMEAREEETKANISNKDGKIIQLQKSIDELESEVDESISALQKLQKEKDEIEKLKSSLEVALKQSQEKLKEMETNLQNELKASEKSVRQLKELNTNCTATARGLDVADAENGSKGLKLQWQTAVASTGTVAAAAAMFYLIYARRR